ncbi:glycosyltransferase [Planomonospora sp. ID67723]|uniref:glycosyltransferase family 2 protein n=1 Tax=Planomonospora sp. ID67723 TaxID=2738134 RepID=UPI0018C430A7|nr:glycosyltransferase family 2 protein [Planomonospora sp. ID67723]MBG0827866.1 glycosyltransferase [Planomonospora sp. ID67723]
MHIPFTSADTVETPKPLIRLNDFGCLTPPELGSWSPRRTVSIVIPAYRCDDTLQLTLASLAAQSYPSHLTEVIVVDDGEEEPLRLPETVPENTRVIRPQSGWGIANAFHSGVAAAEGDVVHRLDADLVLCREHVEAQMRWHHLADYLVLLGRLRFNDYVPGSMSASDVHAAVAAGAMDELFGEDEGAPQWTEQVWDRTGDLRQADLGVFRLHVGATVSLPRRLYWSAGGMDTSLLRGSDTEIGYRLAQAGAVFVADRESHCRHLGSSTVMRRQDEVKRYTKPFMAERIPYRQYRPPKVSGRQYLVPTVEAVVVADGQSLEDVRATVNGLLLGWMSDISVSLVGSWHLLTDGRHSPLDAPLLDLRLIRETYRGESRVRFVEKAAETAFPTPFRFTCPAGWLPGPDSLGRLVKFADDGAFGLVCLALDENADAVVRARLERTAAVRRAQMLISPGDGLDDMIHEVFGTVWEDGRKWGILPAGDERPVSPAALSAEVERWRQRAEKWEDRARRWKREAREQRTGRPRWRIDGTSRLLPRAFGKGLRLVGMGGSRHRSVDGETGASAVSDVGAAPRAPQPWDAERGGPLGQRG